MDLDRKKENKMDANLLLKKKKTGQENILRIEPFSNTYEIMSYLVNAEKMILNFLVHKANEENGF